ncbi:MAG: potassium transporter TrkG [Paracoccus sp. (in: a-proteobacteria)]|nr:potassium transporter TrkG [Paracoccus sp. (in: a-proteobacteria)]
MSLAARIAATPALVTLSGASGALMLVPAGYASAQGAPQLAATFAASGMLVIVAAVTVYLAIAANPRRAAPLRSVLRAVLGLMIALPLVLALPLYMARPDHGLIAAWWEMVSALTTTGATLYAPGDLAAPLHLWRGIVGWLGGLFILVTAISVFAPLRLGGFEILLAEQGDSQPGHAGIGDPQAHLMRSFAQVAPVYAGLTGALWVALLIAGDRGLSALMHAMGTLSTSGIGAGLANNAGWAGEIAIAVFLILALSRRFWPGGGELRVTDRAFRDPELRMALALTLGTSLVLLARHFAALPDQGGVRDGSQIALAISAAWGGFFNALSFLTTTGWSSAHWHGAQQWSGLSAPGLLLAALAIMGGGAATAAGGVKLLRVYALARQSERELDRLIYPSAVWGGGAVMRRLRGGGAYLAFVFFMLFALSISVTVLAVSLGPVDFDTAMLLSIAALTNTGQLAGTIPLISAEGAHLPLAPWDGWANLPGWTKITLAGAMIVGRLETLAILAMFAPDYWRR